jgi:hypothetical protein
MGLTVAQLAWIDAMGYHYADYPTFLQFVQQSYQGIYGNDVYLGADSMDGQWTAIEAQALYDTAALGSATYSSFSPISAQGVGLSRLVKINGLAREIPTNSTAILTIVGIAGTVITNGIAVDTLNQQWILPGTVTIPMGGSINVTATSQVQGAIQAAANTITGIYTPTNGWQTVNNAAAATPGSPVEQDGTLRARQIVSTANPSVCVLEGTYGAVANVTGVTATEVWENDTGVPDGNGQPPHSIFVVVKGGSVPAIAQAIQVHKTPGTFPWAGPTYTFTVASANATAGATYTNNGFTFTVLTTIASGTTLLCSGTGQPLTSGTLTKASGTGDSTITFTSVANAGGNSQSQVVYDSRGMPITIGFFSPPNTAEIGVQVTLTPGAGWTTAFEAVIAAQIAAYINGLGIGAGQQFGGFVRIIPMYPFAYVPNYQPSMYTITGIEIQINSGGFGTSDIAINYTQLPTCVAGTDVSFIT